MLVVGLSSYFYFDGLLCENFVLVHMINKCGNISVNGIENEVKYERMDV